MQSLVEVEAADSFSTDEHWTTNWPRRATALCLSLEKSMSLLISIQVLHSQMNSLLLERLSACVCVCWVVVALCNGGHKLTANVTDVTEVYTYWWGWRWWWTASGKSLEADTRLHHQQHQCCSRWRSTGGVLFSPALGSAQWRAQEARETVLCWNTKEKLQLQVVNKMKLQKWPLHWMLSGKWCRASEMCPRWMQFIDAFVDGGTVAVTVACCMPSKVTILTTENEHQRKTKQWVECRQCVSVFQRNSCREIERLRKSSVWSWTLTGFRLLSPDSLSFYFSFFRSFVTPPFTLTASERRKAPCVSVAPAANSPSWWWWW